MNVIKTILFVYPTLFYPKRGGVERVTDTLTRSFIQRGYKILYLHHRSDIQYPDYDYPAPVFFFPSTDYHAQENIDFYHAFLKEQKVDIIINQAGNFDDSKLYLSIGNNLSVKTISVLHSTPLLNYEYLSEEVLKLRNNSLKEYFKLVGRFLIYPRIKRQYWKHRQEQFTFLTDHTDIVCLLSENYKKSVMQVCPALSGKIIAIGNPNSFCADSLPVNKENIVLYVGRLEKGEKRPDRLLKIWEKVYEKFPEWSLVFVGDGKERKTMETMAGRLKNVYFEGYQQPEAYYKKAAIFCMTSNFEGFPMVLTEAMQWGVVPVAFNSFAAITDVIESGKNGYLINPFDFDDYANQLENLMSNGNLRQEMAQEGFLSIKKYDISIIANQWENVFKNLLNNEE